jgi:hypothetical protein
VIPERSPGICSATIFSAQASFFAGSKDSDDVVEHAVMAAMLNKMVAAVSNLFMSYLRPSCRNEPLCCWCGLYGVCLISENNINRFLVDYKPRKE